MLTSLAVSDHLSPALKRLTLKEVLFSSSYERNSCIYRDVFLFLFFEMPMNQISTTSTTPMFPALHATPMRPCKYDEYA
jgi:hypothetical protein